MVSVGFVLSHEQFTQPRLIDLGIRAEQAGFDMVWTSDHFQPWMDNQGYSGFAWVLLGALGQHIQIPMGTGVTCPTFRYHPAIVAQAFASLGALYPNRVFLGVGSGEAINEQAATGDWADYDERAERLSEAVTLIRQLWTGEVTNFKGRYYQTTGAKLYTLPEQPVPIFIAASGENSMKLAGEHGDGLISDAESVVMPEMRRAFEIGARKSGKDPAHMPIHAESFVFVGERQSSNYAAQMWRFLPNAWTEFVDNPNPRDILERAEAALSLNKVTENWVVGADAQTHIENIEKMSAAGVTHLYIHSGQAGQEAVIDFYGREVLPHIRHEQMQLSELITHMV